jgi:putative ABC transport system permease protein
MRTSTLLARNLAWYWRTNLATVLGVAVAAAVLGGAAVVGESVRGSLRDLALRRLGNADYAIARNGFFRDELSAAFPHAAPLVALAGTAAGAESGKRAYGVEIVAVDERYWKFQELAGAPPEGFDVLLTPALGRELGVRAGDAVLLRVAKPSGIPLESLHGRKDGAGKTIRLTVRGDAPELSLRPQQGEVRAAFVSLKRLQRELDLKGVNTILATGGAGTERILKSSYSLEDLGIRLRVPPGSRLAALESDSAIIGDDLAQTAFETARGMNLHPAGVLAYVANTIRVGGRSIPYSVVAAVDPSLASAPAGENGITLNEWATRDLGAKPGDSVSLEYYLWKPEGGLETGTSTFRMEREVRMSGGAEDRAYTPAYPGITAAKNMREWDPPFPLDMRRIRPQDESYWERYGATPKAFIRLDAGRRLWGTRFGSLTSIRIGSPAAGPPFAAALRDALDPVKAGLQVSAVKEQALLAARGATDFGEYFAYFSFFLVVSALLLAGLFFRLGVEQRTREVGTLRALGFAAAKIRGLFLLEGAALSVAGGILGAAASLAYGWLVMLGLRTWWIGAVGTRALTLHGSLPSAVIGSIAAVAASMAAVAWTLRGLGAAAPRGLLAGGRRSSRGNWRWKAAAGLAALAAILSAMPALGALDSAAGFFGAGAAALAASLLALSAWLRSRGSAAVRGRFSLGVRNVAYRPGRSIVCIALIASAAFVIASLDAFRRSGSSEGTGGFPLLASSELPVVYDLDSPEGRAALGLPDLGAVRFFPFRVREGDDASCLNLFQPRSPRILGGKDAFLRNARFPFQSVAERAENPWLLLEAPQPDGAIPAIADANSLTYSLHRKLGEAFDIGGVRFRIVAALRDSLFQSELIVSEANFLRLYPDSQGYRFFLVSAAPASADLLTSALEESLSAYGFDVERPEDRIAAFHRVENTYLSTFRALGGLGLALGAIGLSAVLMRNALERRRELALLRAVGYRPIHIAAMALFENGFLLLTGLAIGCLCAALAVAPVLVTRGGGIPVASLGAVLGITLVAGLASSVAGIVAVVRSPLLEALRSE